MFLQEDESEIARRKMKQEEEEVDVEEIQDEDANSKQTLQHFGENDEEACWADEDPDDDMRGWKMKLVIEEDVETV